MHRSTEGLLINGRAAGAMARDLTPALARHPSPSPRRVCAHSRRRAGRPVVHCSSVPIDRGRSAIDTARTRFAPRSANQGTRELREVRCDGAHEHDAHDLRGGYTRGTAECRAGSSGGVVQLAQARAHSIPPETLDATDLFSGRSGIRQQWMQERLERVATHAVRRNPEHPDPERLHARARSASRSRCAGSSCTPPSIATHARSCAQYKSMQNPATICSRRNFNPSNPRFRTILHASFSECVGLGAERVRLRA